MRALAAFLVFAWHFIHGFDGHPTPFGYLPAVFPLALVDEGHCGVALFMTLSGYLFAKLLDGKAVHYPWFFWNRFLRLAPLLILVMVLAGVDAWAAHTKREYLLSLVYGLLLPTWPNSAWSITVELHFYLLLPLLLALLRRSVGWLLAMVGVAIVVRVVLFGIDHEVQSLAYWTLVGRIDQFVLGIAAFSLRRLLAREHGRAAAIAIILGLVYWIFDAAGGFYLMPSYPSSSPVWIVLPTIEGACFAALIAWYDTSFAFTGTSTLSRGLSAFGTYSYSIYLLHVLWVFDVAKWVDAHVLSLGNFYVACVAALVAFLCMGPIGYLSYRFIEAPFLRLRRPYLRAVDPPIRTAYGSASPSAGA